MVLVNNKPITIDGVTYISRKEAGRILGVSQSCINRWINLGYKPTNYTHRLKQTLSNHLRIACSINGINFTSKRKATEHFGVCVSTINRWLELGINNAHIIEKDFTDGKRIKGSDIKF